MWRYMSLGLLSLVLASCSGTRLLESNVRNEKYIVGYLFQGNNIVNPDSLGLDDVTHIMYAFANIKDDTISMGFKNDAQNFKILDEVREKNPKLKILISVGGWGWSGGFSDMCLTSESRAKFIGSAVRFIEANGLDGIDIDWEYPGLAGAGNVHRPEDKQNFTSLLAELRDTLDELGSKTGRYFLITAAAGASDRYLANTEMTKDMKYLDFINLMTYDFSVPGGDTVAGHNAPLFTNPRNPYANSADAAVASFEAAGVPPSKIVLGVPFYGHAWHVDSTTFYGLYEPGGPALSRIRATYGNLVMNYIDKNGYVRHWDSTSCVPYLFNRDSSTFISYDDPQSLRDKCEYIEARELKGVMFWSFESDYRSTLLKTLAEELR